MKRMQGMFFFPIAEAACILSAEEEKAALSRDQFAPVDPASAATLISAKIDAKDDEPAVEIYVKAGVVSDPYGVSDMPNIGLVFMPGDGTGARYMGHGLGGENDQFSNKAQAIWKPYINRFLSKSEIERLLERTKLLIPSPEQTKLGT